MAEDREKISTGPNERADQRDDRRHRARNPRRCAGAGREELPEAPSDEEVERIAEKLHAPTAERDTLPLEGE